MYECVTFVQFQTVRPVFKELTFRCGVGSLTAQGSCTLRSSVAGATRTELAAELRRTIREVIGYGLDPIDPQRDIRYPRAKLH